MTGRIIDKPADSQQEPKLVCQGCGSTDDIQLVTAPTDTDRIPLCPRCAEAHREYIGGF